MRHGSLVQVFSAFFVFAGFAASAAETCQHSESSFKCVEFLHNYDGDTLTVTIPSVHPLLGQEISVRVLGIDAPEIRGEKPCERQEAERAKVILHNLLANAQRIDLRSIGRDKYFRVLAEVEVDGKSVSEEMLREGVAVPYDGGEHANTDWCSLR